MVHATQNNFEVKFEYTNETSAMLFCEWLATSTNQKQLDGFTISLGTFRRCFVATLNSVEAAKELTEYINDNQAA